MSHPLRTSMLVALIPLAACSGEASERMGARPDTTAERIARVESGLRMAVEPEGEPAPTFTIEERLAHYGVPGVSVAVIDDGRVAWSRAWGVADTGTGAPVTPGTLFQAASISKPVAALAALSLVEDGRLALDGPVNGALTSWRIPDSEFTADSAVTLRGLLTHSAGLTVWGFPGYARGEEVPGTAGVLDGTGNTDAVSVYKVPGSSWQYSGGGFTVMQLLLEDVTGRPFEAVVRERVLEPAGMERSTYEQPLPEARRGEAARAHEADGTEVAGEWHTYPEKAAAGLWTTPTDLARLSVHMLEILDGSVVDGVVSRETLEAMLTPHHAGEERYRGWGLGIGLGGEGDARRFSHGGSNRGFRANWVTYRDRGQGIAVMTNGERGSALASEISRSVAAEYGWPDFQPEVRPRIRPAEDVLASIAGEYAVDGQPNGPVITIEALAEGRLQVRNGDRILGTLWAESEDVWYDPADGTEIRVERDQSGAVSALVQADGPRLIPR